MILSISLNIFGSMRKLVCGVFNQHHPLSSNEKTRVQCIYTVQPRQFQSSLLRLDLRQHGP